MKNKVRGAAFRLATTVGVTAIIFSAVGMHQSHLCKRCDKGAAFH